MTLFEVAVVATGDSGVKVELFEDARAGVKACADWVISSMNKCTNNYGAITGFGATSRRRTKQESCPRKVECCAQEPKSY